MRLQVRSGSYEVEVEAIDCDTAVVAAFLIRLPNSLGEIIGIHEWNEKRQKFGHARYAWTATLLDRIGANCIFIPVKRGFVLNTQSSLITAIEQ